MQHIYKYKFKPGDKVVVINNSNYHDQTIGNKLTIKENIYSDDGYYRVEESESIFFNEDLQLSHTKPSKTETGFPEFKKGDVVEIIGNSNPHSRKIGSKNTIVCEHAYASKDSKTIKDKGIGYKIEESDDIFRACDLKLVKSAHDKAKEDCSSSERSAVIERTIESIKKHAPLQELTSQIVVPPSVWEMQRVGRHSRAMTAEDLYSIKVHKGKSDLPSMEQPVSISLKKKNKRKKFKV